MAAPGRRLAPGPRGNFLIGSYLDLQRDPLGFFVRGSREYGHIFRFRPFPPATWHFLSHPDYLDHLLQRHHANYPKGIFGRLVSLAAGDGLIAAEGPRWVRERRLLQPAFEGSRLPRIAEIMTRAIDRMLDSWEARRERPRELDVADELMRLTLSTASRALCGMDIEATASEFADAFRETLAYLDHRLVHPFALPLAVPTRRNRRYHRAAARLNRIIQPLIEERRRENLDRGDVLSALLAARDDDGSRLADREIREELKTLLTAGHETTGATLFWSVYLLARHPQHEQTLHAELDAIGRPPTIEDLPRLSFTRMVIEESLRLYPTIVWLGRVAAKDDEIAGYSIPAGSAIVFSMYVTQRHPDFWDEPDAFDPGRFLPERSAARRRGLYIPFGLGPRHCIGDRFAMMEAMLALARICRRFRLRLTRDEEVVPQLLATLRPPVGVSMRVEPR